MKDKGNGKDSSETIAANIKVIEEEMAHLYEHLLILNRLVEIRRRAYQQTTYQYLRVRDKYESLDRALANLSKSTTICISNDAVKARMKKRAAETLDAKIKALGKDELANLISQLEATLSQ